jgi:excisionase family DNA binding protein
VSAQRDARPLAAVPRLALSVEEAAASLGVSRDLFDDEVRPELRVVRVGRRLLVPVRELERYLAENAARVLDDPRFGGA